MKQFKAQNTGNKVIINCATLDETKKLKQAIIEELKKSPLGLKIIGQSKDLFEKEVDVTGVIEFIKNVLLGIDCSDEFDSAVFQCLRHCTYKDVYKIDKELFERDRCPEAREDYYEIIIACVEENLRPFLKSLVSLWKTHFQSNETFQKLGALLGSKT